MENLRIMNNVQLIEKVAETLNLSKANAGRVVSTVFDTIQNGMTNDGEVKVSGFGTFIVRDRKARTARNPKTGETVTVDAKKAPAFKPAKPLKEVVNG